MLVNAHFLHLLMLVTHLIMINVQVLLVRRHLNNEVILHWLRWFPHTVFLLIVMEIAFTIDVAGGVLGGIGFLVVFVLVVINCVGDGLRGWVFRIAKG